MFWIAWRNLQDSRQNINGTSWHFRLSWLICCPRNISPVPVNVNRAQKEEECEKYLPALTLKRKHDPGQRWFGWALLCCQLYHWAKLYERVLILIHDKKACRSSSSSSWGEVGTKKLQTSTSNSKQMLQLWRCTLYLTRETFFLGFAFDPQCSWRATNIWKIRDVCEYLAEI